ncbi:MAG: N-6 DNA methylase [Flexilinea sp.]
MQTRNRNSFTTIQTEGALLPVDLLQRIRLNDSNLEGLDAESYHLAPGEKVNEAINRSWNRLSGLWGAFQAARGWLGLNDAGTTLTRERWLLPLFQELGFGRLSISKAVEIEGKSYPISHRWQNVPLHLVGCGIELDKRTPGAAGASRTSPHSLMQEYLNRSDDIQWGVISNGLGLRILRDNATLTRQAYIEFDLESMFDGEIYSDFVLLWLMCHQSRFETTEKQSECLLEKWSKSAQESGTRALDDLRRGVEEAIVSFGQGFLQHPLNGELRSRLKNGDLSAQDYYRQLLRLVYRLIFLFAAEDRDLLLLPGAAVEARQRFQYYYSTTRLRALAQKQRGSRHHDRYETLRLVMNLLGSDSGCPELAIPALGGFLFDARSTADLNDARLDNQALLSAVRSLAFITEGNTRRAVDYRNLGPEELGSVYESLLELHPLLNTDAGSFQLTSAAGNERKTTGSYYTPSSLIQVLLDSALDPVIEDRLKGKQDAVQQEQALLDLKICDPACGSGHFLIAGAHRIAGRLAEVRAGENEPSPNETRRALRDVIRHCIYGVDINPMAVELCKVNLWLESLEPGKPLSFLDAHIKCGNSLVGMGPKMSLEVLEVPDEAFNPVTGDHKDTATSLKKRNKQEREGQESLFVTVLKTKEDLDRWLAERTRALEAMPEDSAAEVQAKADVYQSVNESAEYRKQKQIADLWTSSFFWKILESECSSLEVVAPTHGQLRRFRDGGQIQTDLLEIAEDISQLESFFHWPLEFAEVSAQGGFDSILGNPPWERIKLQEEEFFATKDPNIASAANKSVRQNLINNLSKTNPILAGQLELAKHGAEAASKFVRQSGRFPLSAVGDVNTYALFSELAILSISMNGKSGLILPTGIVSDDSLKDYFESLVRQNLLEKVIGFENEEFLFTGIANVVKFCVFITNGNSLVGKPEFAFYLRRISQLTEKERFFKLDHIDLRLLNPNTKTAPVFRTKTDAELTKRIYSEIPIIAREENNDNPWGIKFTSLFHMSNDSGLFNDHYEEGLVQLYESKLFWHFDHRFASYEFKGIDKGKGGRGLPEMPLEYHRNPDYRVSPLYWVDKKEVNYRLSNLSDKNWIICFRVITSAKLERTSVFSVLPKVGLGNSASIMISKKEAYLQTCLLGNLNSLVFDYVLRQKLQGTNLNYFVLYQLPVLPFNIYRINELSFILSRVSELTCTSWDIQAFADDLWNEASFELRDVIVRQWEENKAATGGGHYGAQRPRWCSKNQDGFPYPPFQWDDERRAILRAELDAYYAKLYGLDRDELRYILDPQDVYGPNFPGETFRVLKEKELKLFGEYRTRRLVLEAWDRLQKENEKEEVSRPISIDPPITVEIPQPVYADAWVPVQMTLHVNLESLSDKFRQAVCVSWELENFGKDNSIPLYDAQKFSYFIQRTALADLNIPYREFARGPYSPQVTYKAGAYAKSASYWEVKGGVNIARGRNMKKAVEAAPRVFSDLDQAYKLVGKLAQLSKEDLGGFATVDFASRAIFERGQAITPENIRSYFQSDWPEKVKDTWYTDENIIRALRYLSDLGIFKNSGDLLSFPVDKVAAKQDLQPTLTDFGLYKCEVCGKLVMGYEKEKHEQEFHGGKSVEWKKVGRY